MTQEKIYIGINRDVESYRLTASEGKVLQRKSDGQQFGKEITLGKTWYINGERLAEPHFEVPEDYEEVDEPIVEQLNETEL